jgi:ribA/ribD-fused uncharacterized protein
MSSTIAPHSTLYDDWVFFWKPEPIEGDQYSSHVFSNWYKSPFSDPMDPSGRKYVNVEQYMMAAKARVFKDEDMEAKIMSATEPAEIMDLGRQVHGFSASAWAEHDTNVVRRALVLKCADNAEVRRALRRTVGRGIAEASPKDAKWGIGLDAATAAVTPVEQWPGRNLMGVLWMDVRKEFAVTKQGSKAAKARSRE